MAEDGGGGFGRPSFFRSSGYGGRANTLDRIEVTGSRYTPPRYRKPTVDYTELVTAVFELMRP